MRITVFLLAVITLIGGASLISVPLVMAAEGVIDEVVVTARKREESLQETPISIIAFSDARLETLHVEDLMDLGVKLPNVNLSGAGGAGSANASFYIRGLGSGARNSPNTEGSVGVYIDDAYYGKTDGAVFDVVDVQSIEVLRGPQGTLFGRNSTAGAIRYVTKKPSFEGFEGKVKATLGEFDRRDLKAAVNIPLSETFATRISVASLNRDGYVSNMIDGSSLGSIDTTAVRASFAFMPSDHLGINLTVDSTDSDSTGVPVVATSVRNDGAGIWGAPFSAVEDEINTAEYGFSHENTPTDDFFETYGAGEHFVDRESTGVNLTIQYDFNNNISLKSVTTVRKMDAKTGYDMDGVVADLVDRTTDREIDVKTQEFQLSGATDNVEWIAGLFYLEDEITSKERQLRMTYDRPRDMPFSTGLEGAGSIQVVDPHYTESTAVFGQMTYSMSESHAITAGLRYTEDKKRQSVFSGRQNDAFSDAPLESRTSGSWDAVSGLISYEWNVSDDIFAFATYSRGFRAGGLTDEGPTQVVNGVPEFVSATYDPEYIDNYEIGIRADLLDKRLRVNMTAFFMDATDLQMTEVLEAGSSDTVTRNAGKATINGIEGEITAALNEYVTLGLDFGFLDTRIDDAPPPSGTGLIPVQVGDNLTNAPESSYSVNLDFVFPLTSGALAANVNYGWKDDFTTFPGVLSDVDSYGLLGFDITYQSNSNWSVSVFGTNMTDEEYARVVMDIGGTDYANALGFRMVEPGRPRELGVSLKYEF